MQKKRQSEKKLAIEVCFPEEKTPEMVGADLAHILLMRAIDSTMQVSVPMVAP